jgi:uncharacterized protein YaaN involved in tellurite resistance
MTNFKIGDKAFKQVFGTSSMSNYSLFVEVTITKVTRTGKITTSQNETFKVNNEGHAMSTVQYCWNELFEDNEETRKMIQENAEKVAQEAKELREKNTMKKVKLVR